MQFTPDNLPPCPENEGYNGAFPSDLVNPDRKGKEWCLQYVKAMYYQCKNNMGFFNNGRKLDWLDARQYADGNQSNQRYHEWYSRLKDDGGNTVSYADLNWKIVSPMPKFMAVLKGYFAKLDYKIQATSINPEATNDKEKIQASIWASKQLKPFFDGLEAAAGQSFGKNPVLDAIPFIPDSKAELEMFFKLSYRDQAEVAMIIAQKQVFSENDWKDKIAPELWDDVMRCGVLATTTYVDRISKKIKIRYSDPVNMGLDNFRGHDGEEMARIGEFILMTIAQLKLDAGDQFTEEEYYNIAYKYRTQWGNQLNMVPTYADYVNSDQTNFYTYYDNVQILVFEWYADSSDRIKREVKTKNGVKTVHKAGITFDTPLGKTEKRDDGGEILWTKEVVAVDTKTIYGGKWIVGSDYQYNAGKISDISREKQNPKECIKPMKFYRVTNQSVVERAIPYLDAYMLSFLKMQNLKARAIPQGIMIEISAFENVVLDGKVKSAQELLELAVQTGIIVYRKNSTVDDAVHNSQKPIEMFPGGLGAEFRELAQDMLDNVAAIREVTGISQMFDASQQNPRQPVQNAQLAITGTENALSEMVKGFTWMQKKVAIDICCKLQLLARYYNLDAYLPSMGDSVIERIKLGKKVSNTIYGIELEALPTQEQIQRLIETAKAAVESPNDPSKGGLDYADYCKIEDWATKGNFELASNFFVYKIQKYKEEAAAQAKANIDNQGKQQKELEQQKSEAEKNQLAMETEAEGKLDTLKTKNKADLIKLEYALKKDLLGVDHAHDEAVLRSEKQLAGTK